MAGVIGKGEEGRPALSPTLTALYAQCRACGLSGAGFRCFYDTLATELSFLGVWGPRVVAGV